ncbi:unnamed protein product [Closterium sp. NIES-54]
METVASADAGGLEVPAVEVTSMQFAYPGEPPLISKFNLTLPRGSRCLLIGANGAGKTTLLRVLAGKHMVGGKDVVKVLGRSAFHDTALSCDGSLAYLGGSWSKSVGCAGEVPLQGDFSAEHMIYGVADVDAARRDHLVELLDIDLTWRMHRVSDGQRRRVQICMGLLRPFQVSHETSQMGSGAVNFLPPMASTLWAGWVAEASADMFGPAATLLGELLLMGPDSSQNRQDLTSYGVCATGSVLVEDVSAGMHETALSVAGELSV